MPSVLFVCLGNICRSPLAEGVFRHTVTEAGRQNDFHIASAGTGAWHVGKAPDPRSVTVAQTHGIDISHQRAQQVKAAHFRDFDFILAMDPDNLANLERLHHEVGGTRPRMFLDNPRQAVPDPYFGGAQGFETVYQMINEGCQILLKQLSKD